ncbi:ABC transporter ATP-binding protein [Planosporangium thailandense]|uniref:ABC transporter ATP-binding protein n=1 Tax=Planosporangium thailandense TaxID=765197 RepID=A0ABX0Y0Q7_9ACTN|nr:ABC transporter ATP-binding protein [Planosporangium thailandense]NJC71940.1 ABC transporter ATP-binding protein [Planosporangium thailandense]
MTEPLVRIEAVSRRFGEIRALEQVSLEIRQGEFFALLGPSGCGKTTLLRILAGFEHPDSGSVTLDDADLLAVPPHRRPVNLMFQSYALFPHMNVAKNIAYGLEREHLPKAEIRERVDAVLATIGLTGLARRRPNQLSGGQRQRVALARAIVKRPRLLLLDEPLSALDKKVRAEMQLELKRLQHEVGITFVVVTHDQEEAMSLADRVAVLSEGRVRQIDAPVPLYERPADLFVADFIGANNLVTGMVGADGLQVPGVGVLPCPVPAAAVGRAATLAVRPERVRLGTEGGLAGVVRDVTFFGGTTRVAVDVTGLDRPLLATVAGATAVALGDKTRVDWSASDAMLLGND